MDEVRPATHHFLRRTARMAARRAERQDPTLDARVTKLVRGPHRYVVRYLRHP